MDGFDALASDRTSSATALLSSVERLLRDALARGPEAVRTAAARVCLAQPSMGAVWNFAAAALYDVSIFDRLVARAGRAPAAAARQVAGLLEGDTRRIVTCSRSAIVEASIGALGLPALCAESRPGLEGRAMAAALARESVSVTVVSDAAIASDLAPGDVVLVGADAVAADWFINKAGTGQLCAAAILAGIPAYVVSGREKCVAPAIASALTLRVDDPGTLWADPPGGVAVHNPLFERVALDRVAAIVTDAGVLAGEMIAAACDASLPAAAAKALVHLVRMFPDPAKAG
jgi:translation initiation factor 2B subunit (eIF-2B alpha/beta/delta family)